MHPHKRYRQILPNHPNRDRDGEEDAGSGSGSASRPHLRSKSASVAGGAADDVDEPDSVPSGDGVGPASSVDAEGGNNKRKRIGTPLACNDCRRRKVRCDGQRPTCGWCRQRGSSCVYNDKSPKDVTGREQEAREVVELLRSAPEDAAMAALRALRSKRESSPWLTSVREHLEGSIVAQQERLSFWQPDSTVESELMGSCPVSYPALGSITNNPSHQEDQQPPFPTPPLAPTPSSPGDIPSSGLFRHSSVDGVAPDLPPQWAAAGTWYQTGDMQGGLHPLAEPSVASGIGDTTTWPYCDDRLNSLEISFWTDVPVPSTMAARAISLYLQTDHPLLGTFEPASFVGDLIGHRTKFCSHFLANAVLYWACQMYGAIDKTVRQFQEALCDEAERYWDLEDYAPKATSIAGLQLLSLSYLGKGKDHKVLKFVGDASQMGFTMGLFGLEPSIALKRYDEIPEDMRLAASYAAWGTFNWIILMSLFYQQPGLHYPEHPPVLPIPDPTDGREDSDEANDRANYMGLTLPALCRFWRILLGVTLAYHKREPHQHGPINSRTTPHFAELKYRELLSWAETLPVSMMRAQDSPHHVIIFHIWFHAAVLDIFRPFIRRNAGETYTLSTFYSKENNTPDAIHDASVNQLKQLVVFYRTNHASSSYTLLWHSALIYVTNAVVQNTDDPAWRFYFLFCVYSYDALRNAYPLTDTINRALLSMTVRNGKLTGHEARAILASINRTSQGTEDREEGAEKTRATFMADLDLALTEPNEARAEQLAQKFEELAFFDEYTNLDAKS